MPKHKAIVIFLLGCLGLSSSAAQMPDSLLNWSVETTASLSTGDHTPFWMANNRYGLQSVERNFGYLRAAAFKPADKRGGRFAWGAGADIAVAWKNSSVFAVQQLYGEVRWRSLGLTLGAKERDYGFNNPRLSSGNLLFSTNFRPIPELRIEIPEYTPVPWTKNWLAFKGFFSYGMFTDSRWERHWTAPGSKRTENVLFHSKGGFLRIGNLDKLPFYLEGGLQMGCQFGGKAFTGTGWIKMPHGFKDWIKAVIPASGGDDTPYGEQTNCYGNHTGDWTFALTWKHKDTDASVKLYYDHFFEDHSMMFFDYTWRDMLLGVEGKLPANPFVSTIVYEYIYTKDQSGPVYWDHTPEIPEQVSGRDEYYNHYIYCGWQNWGYGIGNPLLISPIYNRDHLLQFNHTRIKAHHLGFEGSPLPWLGYRVLLTYNRSWGTYSLPTYNIERSFNTLFEARFTPGRLKGWSATLSIGSDSGSLLGNSFGAMLTIKKSGWL